MELRWATVFNQNAPEYIPINDIGDFSQVDEGDVDVYVLYSTFLLK